jgi:hypothetical protein
MLSKHRRMKLPQDSIIDPRKISHYLLRRLEDSDKSAFLALAGYNNTNSERLLEDIRAQLLPLDAKLIGPFEYGVKHAIRGTLRVLSIWATLDSSGETRFLTLYPD